MSAKPLSDAFGRDAGAVARPVSQRPPWESGTLQVDVTLKHGIEKTLLEKFPELAGVRDITEHASGDNPYYR